MIPTFIVATMDIERIPNLIQELDKANDYSNKLIKKSHIM